MAKFLQNRHFLADVFHDDIVDALLLLACFLVLRRKILLELLRTHVEVHQWNLLHCILILSPGNLVH